MNIFSKYSPFYKANFHLAYPVIISQLAYAVITITDSILAGRIGVADLASLSFSYSIFNIFLLTGVSIAYGVTPLIAQENGRGNKKECGVLLFHSLIVNTASGILLCCIIFLGLPFISHLGQPSEIIDSSKEFVFILGTSIIPVLIFQAFRQFAEGLGFTRQVMIINITGNILNFTLAVILAFGFTGIKPLGLIGIGIATLFTRVFTALVTGVFVFYCPAFRDHIKGFKSAVFNSGKCKQILNIGFQVALQYIFKISSVSISSIMVGWAGTMQMASHQIVLSITYFTYMAYNGIAAASIISTGNNFARRNINKLKLSAVSNYHIVLGFGIIFALGFIFLRNGIPEIYTKNTEIIRMASNLLIIAALFQILDGLQVVGNGILRGMSDVKITSLVTFTAYWIIVLPAGYLLCFDFGLSIFGIWVALCTGLFISSVFLIFRMKYLIKKLVLPLR